MVDYQIAFIHIQSVGGLGIKLILPGLPFCPLGHELPE